MRIGSGPAWATLAFGVVVLTVACLYAGTRFALWSDVATLVAVCAAVYAVVVVLVARRMVMLAVVAESYVVLAAIAFVAPLVSYMFAATALPLADARLIEIDRAVGFSWLAVVEWFRNYPTLTFVMCCAYASIKFQPVLLMLALAMQGPEKVRVMTSATALTLAITVAIFPFLPALGGYLHYGLPQSAFPAVEVPTAWAHFEVLGRAREGLVAVLDRSSIDGIITFPSFHASTAIIYGYFWWQVPYVRYPAAVLNAAMLVSTVPIGGHYLVDVVAGSALAAGCIWAMARYHRRDRVATEFRHSFA